MTKFTLELNSSRKLLASVRKLIRSSDGSKNVSTMFTMSESTLQARNSTTTIIIVIVSEAVSSSTTGAMWRRTCNDSLLWKSKASSYLLVSERIAPLPGLSLRVTRVISNRTYPKLISPPSAARIAS